MTIHQMLTTVRQATSQVGASRGRGYEDEELVFILNKMQTRYVDRQLELADDGTCVVKYPSNIRPLLVADKRLLLYQGAATMQAILPGDLLYIAGKSALLACPPASKAIPPVTFYEIAVEKSAKSAGPFYELKVKIGADDKVAIPALVPYNDVLEKSRTVDAVFHYLTEMGLDVYRGTFGNKRPSVQLPQAHSDVLIVRSSGEAVAVYVDSTIQRSATFTFNGHEQAGSTTLVPMDLVNGLLVHDYIKTPYFKPTVGKVLATVDGSELKVFGPDNGIVVGVYLSYVRKPRPMDVILSRDCELPVASCEAICDMAVEYITKGTNPGLYQVTRADNDKPKS